MSEGAFSAGREIGEGPGRVKSGGARFAGIGMLASGGKPVDNTRLFTLHSTWHS